MRWKSDRAAIRLSVCGSDDTGVCLFVFVRCLQPTPHVLRLRSADVVGLLYRYISLGDDNSAPIKRGAWGEGVSSNHVFSYAMCCVAVLPVMTVTRWRVP